MRRVSVLALLCYFIGSRVVDNLYPFSTYSMYAGRVADSASRIAVRAGGQLREVREFTDWELDGPVSVGPEACEGRPPWYSINYVDIEAAAYVEAHRGTGSEPVELVRHIWRFGDGGIQEEDCVLHHARATRR